MKTNIPFTPIPAELSALLQQVRLVGETAGPTTGLSRYGRHLAEGLTGLGLSVEVVAPRQPRLVGPARPLARRLGFDLAAFFRTYPTGLADGSPAAGVITHLTSQNQASAIAFTRSRRLVVTVHDLITLAYRHDPELTGYMKFYDRLFDNLAGRGLKHAAYLIADSEHTRQEIIRHLGYPAEQVAVVPPGVDHKLFRPQPVAEEFYRRCGLEPGTPCLLYVGSEDPRKNLKRVLQAFAILATRYPQLRLLKVGTARFGPQREELTALVRQLGLDGKVLFFDQPSDQDLVAFYNLAQGLIFVSLHEGFGLPALEAMACGTPVVVSDRTALPEIVGSAGLTVNPYSIPEMVAALERLLTEPRLAQNLARLGQERATRFTWEQTARQTLSVYEAVIGSGETKD